MKRVEARGTWSFISPKDADVLNTTHGEEFEREYLRLEAAGRVVGTVEAIEVLRALAINQASVALPYVLFKDHVNNKSNQKNLGTIRCSNLCAEITEFTAPDEVAVCTLGTINIRALAHNDGHVFNFKRLAEVARIATKQLNNVIDVGTIRVREADLPNKTHRPIGLGVQGLADVFYILKMPYDSPEAKKLNTQIFKTIYCAAVKESARLARVHGPYESFAGSPVSRGLLQCDLWSQTDDPELDELRVLASGGLRNSLLIAQPPTQGTSVYMGTFSEGIDPPISNVFTRGTQRGYDTIINPYLQNDLIKLGLWSRSLYEEIVGAEGSIQELKHIPEDIRRLYRTANEMSNRVYLELSADRGRWICQSQSLNLFLENPEVNQLTTIIRRAWALGLKTGIYYLRKTARAKNARIGIKPAEPAAAEPAVCTRSDPGCLSCSG
jgi:ribonucleoside-diphosphate reductase alpha chain